MDITKVYSKEAIWGAGVTAMRGRYYANLNREKSRQEDPGLQYVQLPSGIYLARDAVHEAPAEYLAHKGSLNSKGIGMISKAQKLDDVYKEEVQF